MFDAPREPDQKHEGDAQLSEADRSAVDRVLGGGFDPSQMKGESSDTVVARLLGLLGTPVPGEQDRIARMAATELRALRGDGAPSLDAQSESMVDEWMGDPTVEQAQMDSLAGMVTTGAPFGADARQSLIETTVAALQNQDRILAPIPIDSAPSRGGFRLADLFSIAAMLLICASILMPAMTAVNRQQEKGACLSHMQASARAFGAYAGDHAESLPMATAGFGGSWIDVGTPGRSNSANLYTLKRSDYASLEDLACPGNPNALLDDARADAQDWRSIEEVSYSYRILPGDAPRRVMVTIAVPSQFVVAADRSPITLHAIRGIPVVPEANSPNHGGRGQYTLRLDQSTQWTGSPVVDGDNIWLPRGIERVIQQVRAQLGIVDGTEMPEGDADAFVGP